MSGDTPQHVTLVGLSGSGKSSVAPLVAESLGVGVVDLDAAVEAAAGCSVASIFADQGEAVFRAAERSALLDALDGPDAVIATGGGIVLDPLNRSTLVERSCVVWLRSGIDQLVPRIEAGAQRRPLLSADTRTAVARQLAEREVLYTEVAAHVVDTDGLDLAEVAQRVVSEVTGG